MSTFETKIRKLDRIDPHPNADRLELAVIGGYRAVVQKGIHKPGDLILYIQEDSVFTDLDVAKVLNVDTYLTGKEKNRVKAIRLRGVLSQGIVLPLRVLGEYLENNDKFPNYNDLELNEGTNFSDILKIEKYEEPIPIEMRGQVRPWPNFIHHYDLENIKRPESMAAMVDGEEVVVTEKLHGTNMTVAIGPGLEEGEEAFVCSRNMALKESDTNVYWRAARKYNLIQIIQDIVDNWPNAYGEIIETISIRGEVLGVQDLKYGFKNGDIGFRAFDIMINGKYLNYDDFKHICNVFNIPIVPEIYRGPYDYDKIAGLIERHSTIADHIMEGGVVVPVTEREDLVAGRVKFKFISEQYLTRKGGTELH